MERYNKPIMSGRISLRHYKELVPFTLPSGKAQKTKGWERKQWRLGSDDIPFWKEAVFEVLYVNFRGCTAEKRKNDILRGILLKSFQRSNDAFQLLSAKKIMGKC